MHPDTLLGYLDDEPIWLMFGAEDPDTEEEEEEESEEEESEEEEEDSSTIRKHPPSGKKDAPLAKPSKPVRNWTSPSQKEWERTRAALKKANETQAAARRAALEKAKKEGMDEAAAKARAEALEEKDNQYRPMIYKKDARILLAEQGCKNPTRFLPMIDFTKCSLDDDGEVLGLEEQINGIKADFPEAFQQSTPEPESKKKSAPPAKKVGAASGTKDSEKPDKEKASGASRIAGRLTGVSS